MARRVLRVVDALAMPHAASPTARQLSVSVGIGCYDDHSAGWAAGSADSRFAEPHDTPCRASDLVRAADQALYGAKQAGRGQARLLDIADVDTPQAAIAVASASPSGKSRGAA